jgi:hypothetical protein
MISRHRRVLGSEVMRRFVFLKKKAVGEGKIAKGASGNEVH